MGAETRLTEHVWQRMDGVIEYRIVNRRWPVSGDALELAQALLAERERAAKLRAALEDIERSGERYVNRVAYEALREDGERMQERLDMSHGSCEGTVDYVNVGYQVPQLREDGEAGDGR